MRGKASKHVLTDPRPGITPAYAGKSALATAVADLPRDHPRLCGEKLPPFCPRPWWSGSPPPMRGKVP